MDAVVDNSEPWDKQFDSIYFVTEGEDVIVSWDPTIQADKHNDSRNKKKILPKADMELLNAIKVLSILHLGKTPPRAISHG